MEAGRKKKIIIGFIILILFIIVIDVAIDFNENTTTTTTTDIEVKETDTANISSSTSKNQKYYDLESDLTEEEELEKKDYIYEELVSDFVEAEIFAMEGNFGAINNMLDLKSQYGNKKIKELKNYQKKGFTLTFRGIKLEKYEEEDKSINVYVFLYLGKVDNNGKVYTTNEYRNLYTVEKKSQYRYIFTNEKTW